MVFAGEQLPERIERVGFRAFRQFLRTPGGAHLAFGPVTVALGQERPRQRKPALGAQWLIAGEAADRGGVGAILPQPRFRPPAQFARARPARVVGEESRVAGKAPITILLSQDEPFDEFLGRGVAEGFLDGRRFADLGLPHQIDRLLHRRKIAGQ